MDDPAVAAHLARYTGKQARALDAIRQRLSTALTGTLLTMSYGMPTFKADGVAVIGFDGFAHHNSIFPYSSTAADLVVLEGPALRTGKGTIQLPADEICSARLLRALCDARIQEINASFPRPDGTVKEFFSNGQVKIRGRMRDGLREGEWVWFRRDGTVTRRGQYRAGQHAGRWQSFDRSGQVTTESMHPRGSQTRQRKLDSAAG